MAARDSARTCRSPGCTRTRARCALPTARTRCTETRSGAWSSRAMPDTPVVAQRKHLAVWPAFVPHRLDLPRTSVWENLAVSARRHPDKAAFICYDSPITYGELHRDV